MKTIIHRKYERSEKGCLSVFGSLQYGLKDIFVNVSRTVAAYTC